MRRWEHLMQAQERFARAMQGQGTVSPEDPYLQYFADAADPDVYHLYFDDGATGGSVWMHLICGTRAALLIDTGYGVGDLAAAVRGLTPLPVWVVNTHWHGDHSGGNGQFEKVFLHENDIPYLETDLHGGAPRLLPVARSYGPQDVIAPGGAKLIPVQDGHCFDLGGRTVEMLLMPGHSAGHCMLLDSKSGMLFTGDAVLSTPTLIISGFPVGVHPALVTVQAYADALAALAPRLNGVSALYPSHGRLALPPQQLAQAAQCAREILQGADDPVYTPIAVLDARIHCSGNAMIVYTCDRICYTGKD